MTQAYKYHATPKHAAKKRAKIDKLLDPDLFKALADPNRARVLACLIKCARPCSVTEVAACCSVDFSMVARQLSALAKAGLLDANKEGRTMWYTARNTHLATTFHALADAIDEWNTNPCTDGSCQNA
jgi:ArsR family transcriptional regulator, arsenate/arsenite/antimonite-responsive transcriptional repressor